MGKHKIPEQIILKLPLPPTDNERLMLNPETGRMIKSNKYRAWEAFATIYCWDRFISKLTTKLKRKNLRFELDDPTSKNIIRYRVRITLLNERSDFSNYEKCLKDFLKGKLYTDDKWIKLLLDDPIIDRSAWLGSVEIFLGDC